MWLELFVAARDEDIEAFGCGPGEVTGLWDFYPPTSSLVIGTHATNRCLKYKILP